MPPYRLPAARCSTFTSEPQRKSGGAVGSAIVAGLLTEPPATTAGLLFKKETCGPAPWLGQETGHNGRCSTSTSGDLARHQRPAVQLQAAPPHQAVVELLSRPGAPGSAQALAQTGLVEQAPRRRGQRRRVVQRHRQPR